MSLTEFNRMRIDAAFQGSLFANNFLCESVVDTLDWQAIDDGALDDLEAALWAVFEPIPIAGAFRWGIVAP